MRAAAEGSRARLAWTRAPRGTAPVPMQPPMRPALVRRRDRRVAARAHRVRAGRRFPPPRISAGENLCHGFFGIVSGAFRAVFWSIRGVSGCSNGLSRRAAPNRPPPRARGRHLRDAQKARFCTAASGQWRIDSFGFAPVLRNSEFCPCKQKLKFYKCIDPVSATGHTAYSAYLGRPSGGAASPTARD
eukprot:COSAG06_NODE_25046_length_646_cov_3.819013_1_plen_187_part_10